MNNAGYGQLDAKGYCRKCGSSPFICQHEILTQEDIDDINSIVWNVHTNSHELIKGKLPKKETEDFSMYLEFAARSFLCDDAPGLFRNRDYELVHIENYFQP